MSDSDVLSNFYPRAIIYNIISFASSEHAYQYEKCVSLHHKEAVESILSAPTAKYIAASVIGDTDYKVWIHHSESTMLKVLFKAKCHQPFHDESGDSILVEDTSNTFWGAGLSPTQVINTKPSYFKGDNIVVKLLMVLRTDLQKEITYPKENAISKQNTPKKVR